LKPLFQLYEEDAIIGHREFDLKLTHRVKMSMVGVPEMSFNFWAAYVPLCSVSALLLTVDTY
jgi:DNA mismatch repair ATPase MutS